MKTILLGSNNRGKLAELKPMLEPLGIEVVLPADRGLDLDPVEDRDTLIGNATKKAIEFAEAAGIPALADDSGLEVDALDGAPGVFSARFSGEGATDARNNALLLERLQDVAVPRTARFQCVLVLASPEGSVLHTTHGICEGTILETPRGTQGFGYDPLFVPDGFDVTMAELSATQKSAISHRGRAFAALKEWLAANRSAV